jgi:hypothetical protein
MLPRRAKSLALSRIEPCFTGRPVLALVTKLTELSDSSALWRSTRNSTKGWGGGGGKLYARDGKPKEPVTKGKRKKIGNYNHTDRNEEELTC